MSKSSYQERALQALPAERYRLYAKYVRYVDEPVHEIHIRWFDSEAEAERVRESMEAAHKSDKWFYRLFVQPGAPQPEELEQERAGHRRIEEELEEQLAGHGETPVAYRVVTFNPRYGEMFADRDLPLYEQALVQARIETIQDPDLARAVQVGRSQRFLEELPEGAPYSDRRQPNPLARPLSP